MKKNDIILLILLLLFFPFIISSSKMKKKHSTSTYNFSDFQEIVVDSLSPQIKQALNYSPNNFEVSFNEGHLLINKESNRGLLEFPIENGMLIGIDNGEWGGELLFKPDSLKSKNNGENIKNGNIVSIFQYHNQIYFLEGLAHMDINEGFLYRLNIINDNFTCEKIHDFEDAPMAVTVCKDKIYIVSFGNLYLIENGKKELLIENTFWKYLYPNSIVCADSNTLYIGLRSGIAKVNTLDKTIQFYKFIKE